MLFMVVPCGIRAFALTPFTVRPFAPRERE
jgi:hypothetical protein